MTRPPKKSRRKRDSNPGSSALKADALTTRPTRRYQERRPVGMGQTRSHHTENFQKKMEVDWTDTTCYCRGPLLPRPFFSFLFCLFFNVCVCVCVCVCVLHFFIMYINFYWRENLLHKEKGQPPAEVFAMSAGIGTRNPVLWRQARRPVVVKLPGSFVRLSRYSRTMSKLVAAIAGCGNNRLRQQRVAAIAGWPRTGHTLGTPPPNLTYQVLVQLQF